MQEAVRGRVDLLEQVRQAVATVHHPVAESVLSSRNVRGAESFTGDNSWVDSSLGEIEALISPRLEVTGVQQVLVNGVLGAGGRRGGRVPGPVAVGKGEGGGASVLVSNRVPHSVQVVGAVFGGNRLGIATAVTTGVGAVNFGNSVEGLMDVTNVVDNQAESDGASIGLIGEVMLDLLVVVAVLVSGAVVGEPCGEVLESVKDFILIFNEGEVGKAATLVEVGLVNEVPSSLERVALSLDIVSESGALGDGV